MARPLRIHPPGGYHHVTARGNDRLPIFLDDNDRWSFLRVLAEANDRFACDVHAYCLMSNHIHLVVEDHQGNLSKHIRHVKGVHAQRFNRHHDRTGHLFEGRFWNSLLGDDSYLSTAIDYVHRNPVEAGLVTKPSDYVWSSYQALSGRAQPASCLTTNTVLRLYNGRQGLIERTEGRQLGAAQPDRREIDLRAPVLGTEKFRRNAIEAAGPGVDTMASARRGLARSVPQLTRIADAVSDEWEVERSALVVGRRGVKNTPRSVAVYIARSVGVPLNDIAAFFGLATNNAVSTMGARVNAWCAAEPSLERRVHRAMQAVVGTNHLRGVTEGT